MFSSSGLNLSTATNVPTTSFVVGQAAAQSSTTMKINTDAQRTTEVMAYTVEDRGTRMSLKMKKRTQHEKGEVRRASTVSAKILRVDSPPWRLAPWVDWREWLQMKHLISQNSHEEARQMHTFFSLRRRSIVPVAMTATVALITQLNSDAFAKVDTYSARSALAMTIIRLVNGLTDVQQPHNIGQRSISVSSIANRLQLPPILVEIRHQASHGVLPPLSTLKDAARLALEWLNHHYWQAQHNRVRELGLIEEDVDALVSTFVHVSYDDERTNSQDDLPSTTEAKPIRPKLELCHRAADGDAAIDTLRRMNVCIRNWEKRKNARASKIRHSHFDRDVNTTGIWTDCFNNREWIKMPIGMVPGQKRAPHIPNITPNYNRFARNWESENNSDCLSSCDDISDSDQDASESDDDKERPSKMARIFTDAQEALIAKETSRLSHLFTPGTKFV